MRSAFITTLINSARNAPNLWLLTADLGYSFLEPFTREFPQRFVNVGVAEQNMMSIAAGLALTGKKVVVYSIINFATFRSLEQIRNSICYHCLDVTIVGVGAGYFYGSQGYSHHGIEDIAIMRSLPHLKIYSPIDALQTRLVTEQLMLEKGPSYLRLGRNKEIECALYPPHQESIDTALILKRGEEVMIVALGEAVHQSLTVAELLDTHNISAGVMTFSRVVPIDEEAISQAATIYTLLVIIEEHKTGGLATSVAEVLMKRNISAQVRIFHLPSIPLHTGGTAHELLHAQGLTAECMAQAILEQLR